MAVLYIDGFAGYATADISERWTANAGTWSVDRTGGRNNRGKLIAGSPSSRLWRSLGGAHDALIVGFAFRLDASIDSGEYQRIFQFVSGGSPGVQLGITNAGLSVRRPASSSVGNPGGAVLCATTGVAIHAARWYYVEISVVPFGSGTGQVDVQLDGTPVASAGPTADTTSFAGDDACDTIELGGDSAAPNGILYSDLYVLDPTLGPANQAFLGDCRVDLIRPMGDGAFTDFTPVGDSACFEAVDDVYPDEDATYIGAADPPARQSFTMAALTTSPAVVSAIQVAVRARKEESSARTLQATVVEGGTPHDGGSTFTLGVDYDTFLEVWDEAPGGDPFQVVEGLEFGVKFAS